MGGRPPHLALAERDDVRAHAAVPLSAALACGALRGEGDGTLAATGIDNHNLDARSISSLPGAAGGPNAAGRYFSQSTRAEPMPPAPHAAPQHRLYFFPLPQGQGPLRVGPSSFVLRASLSRFSTGRNSCSVHSGVQGTWAAAM